MTDRDDLTDRQRDVLDRLPATRADLAEALGIQPSTVADHVLALRGAGVPVQRSGDNRPYRLADDADGDVAPKSIPEADTEEGSGDDADDAADDDTLRDVGLGDINQPDDAEPDPDALDGTDRVILDELRGAATVDDLADRVDERPSLIGQRLRDLYRDGWQIYIDDSAAAFAVVDDGHRLRSSEHEATRSRKANRWWEQTYKRQERQFEALGRVPDVPESSGSVGDEDWIFHLTDLHLGDRVTRGDGTVVYDTEIAVGKCLYAARQAVNLADTYNVGGGTCWWLLGGDLVTGEAIYHGQIENIDEWLDNQLAAGMTALMRSLQLLYEHFDTVNVLCQTGNHGEIRANGSSKQVNADLLLYRELERQVATLQEYAGMLGDVRITIGEAGRYLTWEMRDSAVRAHLRHGDDGREQSQTAAGQRDYSGWLIHHEFDLMFQGHFHRHKQDEVFDRPIYYSGAPKPPDEYAEKLSAQGDLLNPDTDHHRKIATAMGVSDEGETAQFDIDTRYWDGDRFIPDDDPTDAGVPDVEGVVGTSHEHARKGGAG